MQRGPHLTHAWLSQVRKLSVKQVVSPIIFDNLKNAVKGGLYDPAFGPMDVRERWVAALHKAVALQSAVCSLQSVQRSCAVKQTVNTTGRKAGSGGRNQSAGPFARPSSPLLCGCRCATCGLSHYECPGHFGHIELAVPIYNPLVFT